MEDCKLLAAVAAAGSGKTSIVVGKIGYALLTGKYVPLDRHGKPPAIFGDCTPTGRPC